MIDELRVSEFRASENNNPNIIKEISVVNFTHLKQLFLSKNNIESLEPLSLIDFSQIEKFLCCNYFHHFRLEPIDLHQRNEETVLPQSILLRYWYLIFLI